MPARGLQFVFEFGGSAGYDRRFEPYGASSGSKHKLDRVVDGPFIDAEVASRWIQKAWQALPGPSPLNARSRIRGPSRYAEGAQSEDSTRAMMPKPPD